MNEASGMGSRLVKQQHCEAKTLRRVIDIP